MNIVDFDYYVLEYIFSFSDSSDLYVLFETCKYLKNLFIYTSLIKTHPTPEFYLENKKKLLWAMSHSDFKFDEDIFGLALRYNDSWVIQYIYKLKQPELNGLYYYSQTIYNENYNMFKWLRKKGFYLDENAFNAAAEMGNLDILRFLENNNCEWSTDAINFAIIGGSIECVKYLIHKGFQWDSDAYSLACDNIEILKYLISISANDLSRPWINSNVFKKAVEIGNVKVCKLLKKYNCGYDIRSANIAFEKGNITVLKWLIDNNYQVDESIINKIK